MTNRSMNRSINKSATHAGFGINLTMNGNRIIESTKSMITRSIEDNKKILELNLNKRDDYMSFLPLLSDDITRSTVFHSMCSYIRHVTTDKKTQECCHIADQMLTEYSNRLNLNRQLYDKIVEYYDRARKDLDLEDKRFLNKLLLTHRKKGVMLDMTKRNTLLRVNVEIAKIEHYMSNEFNTLSSRLVGLTEKELEGLPKDYIKTLPVVDQKQRRFGVDVRKGNLVHYLRYLKNPTIRKNLEFFHNNVYVDTVENAIRLIVLRDKRAKILGLANHAEFKMHEQMATGTDNVKELLNELLCKLDDTYIKEMDTLLRFKKKHEKTQNIINSWDVDHYTTRWKKEYGLDEKVVREYFPVTHVVKAVLGVYQELFKLTFIKSSSATYHPNVVLYKICDEDGTTVGKIYLDLFDRPNKTSQTRCFCLQPGSVYPLNSKKTMVPTASVVSCIRTELLTHSEVLALFHEIGHVAHHIFGKTRYCTASGTNVESDFVETPAQILDNLCWDANILTRLSCHYKTKKPLPKQIIQKMIKIKNLDVGLHYKKTIFNAVYDQLLYSSTNLADECEKYLKIPDAQERFNSITKSLSHLHHQVHDRIMGSITNKDKRYKIGFNTGSVAPSAFDSVILGCDGHHYRYIWSRIYASDVYQEKFIGNSLQAAGMELRKKLLSKGGNVNAVKMLSNYLGRAPSLEGFLKFHNLNYDPEYSFRFNSDRFLTENMNSRYSSVLSPIDTDIYKDVEDVEYTNVHDNRFSEIPINSRYKNDVDSVKDKIRFIKGRFREEVDRDDEYKTETSETLKRYKNIFIKQ